MKKQYLALAACVISALLSGFVFTVDLQACTSDAKCDAGQTCDTNTGECMEGPECSMAQLTAQEAVISGGPYRNSGNMVRTATNSINAYLYDGVISGECHSCIVSQFAQGISISKQKACGPAGSDGWMITFTQRGVLLPKEAVEFICSTVKPEIVAWFQRETDKYQQQLPFSNISCMKEQILLTQDFFGECPWCLNSQEVISFLEDSVTGVKDPKFVTVIHYLDNPESPFYDYDYDSKYDFYFFRQSPPGYPFLFYPELNINNQGETLIHELMHKLGVSDKYFDGPQQACKTDPATGQQYSGYDIMCHRIADPAGGYGYITPSLSELIISEPTAKELGWLSY